MSPYAFTTLVSAFLPFQVQTMLAKSILPWFGGTAGVWTACLLFATVGLPYFLLSTTGPLLQSWYVRRFHGAAPCWL